MNRLAFVLAALALMTSAAAALEGRRSDAKAQLRHKPSLEAVARLCRHVAYTTIHGKGRGQYISLYLGECLRRGGPF